MQPKKFSLEESLRYGWEKTKIHLNFFLVFLLVILIVTFLLRSFSTGNPFTQNISSILSFIFDVMVSIGITKSVLRIISDESPMMDDFFLRDFSQVVAYVCGVILYAIVVIAGIILLIVPGIILAVRLRFYTFLIIEKNLGPISALKESWAMTKGHTWELFLFTLITVALNLIAVVLLGIGLIFTIPMTTIAFGYIYRKLMLVDAASPLVDF